MRRKIDRHRDIRYGYKIMTLIPKPQSQFQLQSYVALCEQSVIYAEGRWTIRSKKNGPLALFASIDDAETFLRDDQALRPADSSRGDKEKVIYRAAYIKTVSKMWQLWHYHKEFDEYHRFPRGTSRSLPAGTILADAICLLECVSRWSPP